MTIKMKKKCDKVHRRIKECSVRRGLNVQKKRGRQQDSERIEEESLVPVPAADDSKGTP
jgi:hypothetical protein